MQLSCPNWCPIPIGTWFHVPSQGNIFISKLDKANFILSRQFTFDLMKLTMSTLPEKQPKIEVSNSKLKQRQEPNMFLEPSIEMNTTDFSTLPKVMVSRSETSVSLITTIPTNHPHYLTMKMMDLTPTQPRSVKMPWPTLKIQMKVQPMKISIRMMPIPKQKLVVMKNSILMPPIDPLILKIVGYVFIFLLVISSSIRVSLSC